MAGIFDEWDAKRERATRPADPAPVTMPRTAEQLDRAQRYARAALEGEVTNIQAVPIGSGRNDQLNKSAVKMGHYVAAGAIDERTVYEVLGAADGGLDYPATAKTIRSGIEAGKLVPALIPESPATLRRNPAPWESGGERSDDPFAARPGDMPADHPATPAAGTDDPTVTLPGDEGAWRALVQLEAQKQRLRRDARTLLDQEDAVRDFRVPEFLPTLTDELQLPDDPVTYAVDELFPTGANVLLTAQYKTGKTTTITNLARSFVDGEPFLGVYAVAPLTGRVAIFNYEVDRSQYRRWLRDAGIRNTDRVAVLNLRGHRLPLTVPYVETWVVEWLKRAEAQVWVVDPFARAATGVDENSNTEVGAWLDTLDVIKSRAGVSELVLPTHTGRGEFEVGDERARGATRLDDWTDVRWLLTKDKSDTRYFRATGRDVETDEGALSFDPATRLLTLTAGDRRSVADRRLREAVLAIVTNRPGVGKAGLREGVRQIVHRADDRRIDSVVAALVEAGEVHTVRDGKTIGHHPGRGSAMPPDPFAGTT